MKAKRRDEDLNEWDTPLPVGLKPFTYRVICMPVEVPEMTPGGIIRPYQAMDAEEYLNYVARIAAIGPGAFKHPKYKALELGPDDFPAIGDWIVIAPHSPMKITYQGVRLIVINDDDILAIVDGPEGWKGYV